MAELQRIVTALSKGVDSAREALPTEEDINRVWTFEDGTTMTMFFYSVTVSGRADVALDLLERGADPNILSTGDAGYFSTPLHEIACNLEFKPEDTQAVVRSAIDKYANTRAEDSDQKQPFQLAQEFGQPEELVMLLDVEKKKKKKKVKKEKGGEDDAAGDSAGASGAAGTQSGEKKDEETTTAAAAGATSTADDTENGKSDAAAAGYRIAEIAQFMGILGIVFAMIGMSLSTYFPAWYHINAGTTTDSSIINIDYGLARMCTQTACDDRYNYTIGDIQWSTTCTLKESDYFTKIVVTQAMGGAAALFLVLGFILAICAMCDAAGIFNIVVSALLFLSWACATTAAVFGWYQFSQGLYCNKKFCETTSFAVCSESIEPFYWMYVAADVVVFLAAIFFLLARILAPKPAVDEDTTAASSAAKEDTEPTP